MTHRIVSMLLVTLMTSTAYAEVRPYALEILVFARPEPVQSITEVFPATEPEAPQSFDLLFALNSRFKNLTPLPDSSRVLRNSALRIQTQLNGEVLFHQRWIHPLTANQAENPWFQISGSGFRWIQTQWVSQVVDRSLHRTRRRSPSDPCIGPASHGWHCARRSVCAERIQKNVIQGYPLSGSSRFWSAYCC